MTDLVQGLEVVRVNSWKQYPWLRHGFSTKLGGVSTVYGGGALNLGWTKEDDPASVAENRRRFVRAVAGEQPTSGLALVGVRQIHSRIIHQITDQSGALAGALSNSEGKAVLEGDGLITDVPGVLLGVGTADCVPVLVVDVHQRVVAAFHAGWRGTVAQIVQEGVGKMRLEYGSQPEDLVAAIGPSIGPCCYSVGKEVLEEFSSKFSYADQLFRRRSQPEAYRSRRSRDGNDTHLAHVSEALNAQTKIYLNLWEANRRQLLEEGLRTSQITEIGGCTACSLDSHGGMRYFSHRAEEGVAGRMLSVAGIVR